MRPIHSVSGAAIPFGVPNVDTDLIVPGRYLKDIDRSRLAASAFYALRYDEDGALRPDSPFDGPGRTGAPILVAGANFGCGSSREQAAWALAEMGICVVIAPSFAEIFAGNAFKNGILLVELPVQSVARLMGVACNHEIHVDLPAQTITTPLGDHFTFEVDPFRKTCLMEGLDEIELTEGMEAEITAYEARVRSQRPWADAPPRHMEPTSKSGTA